MDIILFRNVFNNIILNKIIFKYVHHIFIDIKKVKTTFKWNEVIESDIILAGNGYLNQLKEYYRINHKDDSKLNRDVLLNAIKSKSLDIIKYIIEDLHNQLLLEKSFDLLYPFKQDLLHTASKHGNIDIIKYIESLIRNIDKNIFNWDYVESFKVAPLLNDIKVLQFLYDKLVENTRDLDYPIEYAILVSLSMGRIDFIEWLVTVSKNPINLKSQKYIRAAIRSGKVDILQFCLIGDSPHNLENTNLITFSVKFGNLDVIKWLHENNIGSCTTDAIDYSASRGHLEIIQWLHKNRTEGCTINAMNNAVIKGHFETIKWLHENRTEGCTTAAMDLAASNGHFEIIKWLHHNRTEGCTTAAMDFAAQNGHIDIIKWLHHNRTEGCTTYAIDVAAKNGHLETIKWLNENRTEGYTMRAMDNAAENKHFEINLWFLQNPSLCQPIDHQLF